MHLTNESLIVSVIVGIAAGWLAGGNWLLPQLGVHLGTGTIGLVVNATLGAIVLLIVLRLIGGAGRRW